MCCIRPVVSAVLKHAVCGSSQELREPLTLTSFFLSLSGKRAVSLCSCCGPISVVKAVEDAYINVFIGCLGPYWVKKKS